jgi:RND superfamily putative drug exporter
MQPLTRFILRHKLLVALFWIALAVAGAMTAGSATKRLTTSFSMPGAAFNTDAKITALYHLGVQDPTVVMITLPNGQSVTTPGTAELTGQVFAAAGHVAPGVRVVDYADTADAAFTTRDGRSTFALVNLPSNGPMSAPPTAAVQNAVQSAAPKDWRVQVTGIQALINTQPPAKGAGVLAESLLGGLGALIVLAFVFASSLAFVPLLMAAVSILTTFLAVYGLTEVISVSVIVEFLIALIGLGVAIDYCLLVVTRWREERSHGLDNEQAVLAAMASAGRSVVFSGITVGIGLLALVSSRSRSCAVRASAASWSRSSPSRSPSRCCRCCSPRSARAWTGRVSATRTPPAADGPGGAGSPHADPASWPPPGCARSPR